MTLIVPPHAQGAYGVPRQGALGVPNPFNPLRAYSRQTAEDNASSQGDTVALTFGKTPLPGAVILYTYHAEKPSGGGTASPDIYSITQTGYRTQSIHQHGNLDTTYPYSELWLGRPVPDIAPSTSVTMSGRGGWRTLLGMEVPNLVGYMIDGSTRNWNSGAGGTVTMSFGAPMDCLAVAYGSTDSGGTANLPVNGSGGWTVLGSGGIGWMAIRPLQKGQIGTITTQATRSDTNIYVITLMI